MINNRIYDILVNPVVTEKAMLMSEKGCYIFKVAKASNKFLVKKSVESFYKTVKVKSVNILNQSGKTKRHKGVLGTRASYKKAIVRLEKGCSIDVIEGKV